MKDVLKSLHPIIQQLINQIPDCTLLDPSRWRFANDFDIDDICVGWVKQNERFIIRITEDGIVYTGLNSSTGPYLVKRIEWTDNECIDKVIRILKEAAQQ